jgi:hypothetical protein
MKTSVRTSLIGAGQLGALLGGLFLGSVSAQNLITDGSFEKTPVGPISSGSSYPCAASGWTGGNSVWNWTVNNFWPAAEDGSQYEDIGWSGTVGLSQTFNVATPGEYVLSWYSDGAAGNQYTYNVSITGNSLPPSYTERGSYTWIHHSVDVTLGPGQNGLTFTALTTYYQWCDALIDNVSLDPVPDGSATAGLLGLALAGLAWLRRRV